MSVQHTEEKFVHLNVHSEYSISDGMLTFEGMVNFAKDTSSAAIGLTDIQNLFGAVKFYRQATNAGVKPIFGADVYIYDELISKPIRATLLAKTDMGYQQLTKLISTAYLSERREHLPVVDASHITKENCDQLILLSGHLGGLFAETWETQYEKAEQIALKYKEIFADNSFYLELRRLNQPKDEPFNQVMLAMAKALGLPVVATNAVRFAKQAEFEAHEARVCIQSGYLLEDKNRPRDYGPAQYLKTPEEMARLFSDIPSAITNTVEIAKRCTNALSLGNVYLPNFPTPEGMTIEETLEQQSNDGLNRRLAGLGLSAQEREKYEQRLAHELMVINRMGYPGYFLIVADFISWAKSKGIPVGPGRGSGAGSLVAYVLDITDLDPLKYELLFERFLNPDRVSMPDFDIDFCMEGRDRVIEYVTNKYGRDNVAQIITFGTMSAKAVIRDVGRVLGAPYGFVDKLAKLIPNVLGITITEALKTEEALTQRYEEDTTVSRIVDLALQLEGRTRNASKHAGGVVIAPREITHFTPLYRDESENSVVTQFDKDDVESVGLVKFDFLGLRTLTIIDWTVKNVKRYLGEKKTQLDINTIPLDCPKTFDLLQRCETTAVFQLESRGMKDLVYRLKPDQFEEIIALVALFRPGPLQSGMVDDFIDRKHGRAEVVYPHPALESILAPTYGVILYQEQVMQIAQVLAGYSLGHADILRRAMGKKKPAEMAKQRKIFVDGSIQNGVEENTATYIFDLMEKFAGYGFNKSHSAAYALVAYQTAWLKTHYPAAFMAAVLSSDMDNTDKVKIFFDECLSMGLKVLPPSVNQSEEKFTVVDEQTIRYGLGAIKGLGLAAIEVIRRAAQEGEFKSLVDFTSRVDLRKVNRRAMEVLIRSGAFDGVDTERGKLFALLPDAIKISEQANQDRAQGQADMFGISENQVNLDMSLYASCQWDEAQKLENEKEALGMYFSGHPIELYHQELSQLITLPIENLSEAKDGSLIYLAGYIIGIRKLFTKRGDRMAFITIDDNTATTDLTVFSECFQNHQDKLNKDQLIIVKARVQVIENDRIRLTAEQVLDLKEARNYFNATLRIKMSARNTHIDTMEWMHHLITKQEKGHSPIVLDYEEDALDVSVRMGKRFHVTINDAFIANLKSKVGQENVTISYHQHGVSNAVT